MAVRSNEIAFSRSKHGSFEFKEFAGIEIDSRGRIDESSFGEKYDERQLTQKQL
jgi:hypothetical protein